MIRNDFISELRIMTSGSFFPLVIIVEETDINTNNNYRNKINGSNIINPYDSFFFIRRADFSTQFES